MTEKQRRELRTIMLDEIEEIGIMVGQMEGNVAPVAPDSAIGRISRMDTILNQEISRSSLSSLKQRRVKLEHLLRRLDEPGFGECVDCGELIPMARLKAVPESILCVDCAE
jgi:DnaK suppressor protein